MPCGLGLLGFGFWVSGLEFRDSGFGFRVHLDGLAEGEEVVPRLEAHGADDVRVSGWGFGFRVSGLGFEV